jgi:hypothetical protein
MKDSPQDAAGGCPAEVPAASGRDLTAFRDRPARQDGGMHQEEARPAPLVTQFLHSPGCGRHRQPYKLYL